MKVRKILSIVLALCLLTALLPLQTFAAADPQPIQQGQMYASVRDSAYYPKIQLQEVTAEQEDTPAESDSLWQSTKTYAPTYLTVEKAGVKLREYLKSRQTNFTLYVQSNISYRDVLVDELLAVATKHTGKPTEGDYLLWHIDELKGEILKREMVGANDNLYQLRITVNYYTTAAQEKELTTAVNALLKSLNVKYKSDYAKVKAVYDYISKNITYDYTHLEDENYLLMYTAYAALVNKTAVCQGYASLFYRLMLELGVDCRVITGLAATGEPHAWNIVKLGPVYYNLDATWDAGAETYAFFLRNSVMNATHYRYLEYCSLQFHRDYPMSSTDYVEGVDGVPEHVFATGICGDNAYWTLDWDGLLIIAGTGATYDYSQSSNPADAAPWAYWHEIISTVIVNEGITTLGANLFSWDSFTCNIDNVTLPESLVTIGTQTFRNCDKLTEVRIPNGVQTIGHMAFAYCDNIKTVTFGTSLETIGSDAFREAKSLQSIQLPESLKRIESEAFRSCDALTEITIPASVEVVRGFQYCKGLQVANICGSVIDIYAFDGCVNLHTVVLSEQVTQINSRAFAGCSSLRKITIPKSITTLSGSPFYYSALKEIYFEGDAPAMNSNPLESITGTAYYPAGNETWTEEVRKLDFRSKITWVSYCPGHQWSEGPCDAPRTCGVCGESSGKDGHIYDDGVDGTCNICGVHRETTEDRTVMHMFRMYDPNSGEHFYTGSEVERDNLVAAGWHYEGVGFTFSMTTGLPVYRLYDPLFGEHLYTMDEAEMAALMAAGWNLEGIAFNSANDTEVPQYRLHNPNTKRGAYHFTASEEERDYLISLGWEYQGIGFYSSWK